MHFSSIWPINRTLSGATTPGQSNEGVLHIPQSSSISGTSSSGCLVSYLGHLLEAGVLPLCREAVYVFHSPSWLSKYNGEENAIELRVTGQWRVDATVSRVNGASSLEVVMYYNENSSELCEYWPIHIHKMPLSWFHETFSSFHKLIFIS